MQLQHVYHQGESMSTLDVDDRITQAAQRLSATNPPTVLATLFLEVWLADDKRASIDDILGEDVEDLGMLIIQLMVPGEENPAQALLRELGVIEMDINTYRLTTDAPKILDALYKLWADKFVNLIREPGIANIADLMVSLLRFIIAERDGNEPDADDVQRSRSVEGWLRDATLELMQEWHVVNYALGHWVPLPAGRLAAANLREAAA
jgi:hypothetical protein